MIQTPANLLAAVRYFSDLKICNTFNLTPITSASAMTAVLR